MKIIEEWSKEHPDASRYSRNSLLLKKFKRCLVCFAIRMQESDFRFKTEAEELRQKSQLRKSHEDLDDLRASDEFHNWVEEQSKGIRCTIRKLR